MSTGGLKDNQLWIIRAVRGGGHDSHSFTILSSPNPAYMCVVCYIRQLISPGGVSTRARHIFIWLYFLGAFLGAKAPLGLAHVGLSVCHQFAPKLLVLFYLLQIMLDSVRYCQILLNLKYIVRYCLILLDMVRYCQKLV